MQPNPIDIAASIFQAALEIAKKKKLVLTVTAGRSGTRYLKELFATLENAFVTHESEPCFSHVLRQVQTDPKLSRDFVKLLTIPSIAAANTDLYVTTSHLICKGFLEPILEFGLRPGVILLRRSPRRVARSYLEKETVPGRTPLGLKYLLDPSDPDVLPLSGFERLSDYQLCFWYALEIERRQAHYRSFLTELRCPVVDVTADELHRFDTWRDCLQTLGVADRIDPILSRIRHLRVIAGRWNQNPRKLDFEIDYDAAEGTVWDAVHPHEPWLRAEIERRYAPFGRPACAAMPVAWLTAQRR